MERKTYDNPEALRKERKALVNDAIRHDRKPKRVPIMSQAWTWKACDAGYRLSEYLYNYESRFDAVCQHHEKYEMDMYIELGTRNAFPVVDCYGESLYEIDDEKGHMNLPDFALMDGDDYDILIKDGSLKYYFERGVPYRFGITDKQTMMDAYGKAAVKYLEMVEYNKRINIQYIEKFGVPTCNLGQVLCGMDGLIGSFRGIAGLSVDMRRCPDKLDEVLASFDKTDYAPVQQILDTYDPNNDQDKNHTPLRMTCLSHTIQSAKQFGRFTWPYMKKFIDDIVSRNWVGILYLEGDTNHINDYLQEIPAGHIMLLFEQDDPVLLKKRLPNVTLAGGYPTYLLHTGTPDQCVEKAKSIVDELAYDGNYIFTTDKMLSYPEDGEGANMKAIVDFVKQYGVY